MANENSKIEYESGVTPFLMTEITDSGDHKTFTTEASLFSETVGNAPVVLPNGVLNGAVITVSATEDAVSVSATLCNLNGVADTVVAADTALAVSRPTTDVSIVHSITIDNTGALAVVTGTEGTTTLFSETRGAAGAPAFIPFDSIEIGQVRLTSSVAGAIAKNQIFQTENAHKEMANYPSFESENFTGSVVFESALPLIHTGYLAKAIYASYAEPVFSEQKFANDFAPAEISYSSSSSQVYGATLGTTTESLGKVTFTAILKNGITDPILAKKGQNIFIRYYQDKYKLPHILSQGKISFARSFSASAEPKVTCTLAVTKESVERAS